MTTAPTGWTPTEAELNQTWDEATDVALCGVFDPPNPAAQNALDAWLATCPHINCLRDFSMRDVAVYGGGAFYRENDQLYIHSFGEDAIETLYDLAMEIAERLAEQGGVMRFHLLPNKRQNALLDWRDI